jgi:hypothetical protein
MVVYGCSFCPSHTINDREHAKTANELSAALREHVLPRPPKPSSLIAGSGRLAGFQRFVLRINKRQPEPGQ